MTNFEYYEEKIREIINEGYDIAIVDGEPKKCFEIECNDCLFGNVWECRNLDSMSWGFDEYEPTKTIKEIGEMTGQEMKAEIEKERELHKLEIDRLNYDKEQLINDLKTKEKMIENLCISLNLSQKLINRIMNEKE